MKEEKNVIIVIGEGTNRQFATTVNYHEGNYAGGTYTFHNCMNYIAKIQSLPPKKIYAAVD